MPSFLFFIFRAFHKLPLLWLSQLVCVSWMLEQLSLSDTITEACVPVLLQVSHQPLPHDDAAQRPGRAGAAGPHADALCH